MAFLNQLEEEKKKRRSDLSVDNKSTSFFSDLQSKIAETQKTPSQIAAEEIKTKQPNVFQKVGGAIGGFIGSLKKKKNLLKRFRLYLHLSGKV